MPSEAPNHINLTSATINLGAFEDSRGSGPREFFMEAYSGAQFDVGFGPAVIDLASLQVPEDGFPIFRQHNPELFIGRATEFDQDEKLRIKGVFFDTPAADEVISLSDQGANWQASVGIDIDIDNMQDVSAEDRLGINGQVLEGPFVVLRGTRLKESSFVPLGADSSTSAIALRDKIHARLAASQEQTMETTETTEAPESGAEQQEEAQMEPATVADLRTAFPQDLEHVLSCVESKHTMQEAKAAYADKAMAQLAETQQANVALEAKLRKAKAKANKPNHAAQLGGGSTTQGQSDPITRYNLEMASECKRLRDLGSNGRSVRGIKLSKAANIRAMAADNIARRDPKLQETYIQAFNAARKGR